MSACSLGMMAGWSMGKYKDNFPSVARNRIEIQSATTTDDGYAGFSTAWEKLDVQGEVWAQIKPTSGNETFANQELQSRATHKIMVRYQSQLADTETTAKYRIKYGTRYFTVEAVINLHEDMKSEGKAFQVLMCTENGPENA